MRASCCGGCLMICLTVCITESIESSLTALIMSMRTSWSSLATGITSTYTHTYNHHRWMPGFSLLYGQKKSRTFPGLSRTTRKIFQDLFGAHRCLNITNKWHLLNNIRSVVHCRKFSMKQNVDVSCSGLSNCQHKLDATLLLLVFHLNH